ncbi:acyl carrier protein [Tatumella ptyseos]|uniref:acyl carrier protein n=1 Tax=Tatumella ptyseos TaxID=82987 RepID=UPI0026EE681C|nr:acyl carrier protein [Tatumella ptyseos]WKX25744.1 acyl carrier protein [Tatumella ptyseos]
MERNQLKEKVIPGQGYPTILLVIELLCLITGLQPANVHLQDSLLQDLAMDSIEFIDLLIRLEKLGVKIPDSTLTPFLTVGDIVNYIDNTAKH